MNLSKFTACSALLLFTAHTQAIEYKSATALVFETDPITELNNTTLQGSTAAETFEPAYQKVNLPEVEFRDGSYYLSGPWVKIENWDKYSNASLTVSDTDGDWTVKRGEAGFNEVMTYFHLDKSQRYIQSLGFTGNNGILNKQIRVNSSAQDNYYHPFFTETAYSESDKALSFLGSAIGDRTKIAQAEETDILLFEYMQAMIYDLHPNFGGGDQAAIAGGLGMYWAFSHNYAETQEASDELFQWGDYFLQKKQGMKGIKIVKICRSWN